MIATATLAMRAVDARRSCRSRIASRSGCRRGPDDREEVTVADLLAHASGLTAYLPFFRDHMDGRVRTKLSVRCRSSMRRAHSPSTAISDSSSLGSSWKMSPSSDSPISLRACGKPSARIGSLLTFEVPRECRGMTAPTELDLWRGRLLQGEVHDENAWALGEAAGHAGLFGTAAAVGTFARAMLDGLGGDSRVAQPRTIDAVRDSSTVPNSSRALGWDTMMTTSSCGTKLSPGAVGHTGFTGTSLWIDPEQDLYIVLLTNRVHPTRDNNGLRNVRRDVHDAVVDAVRTADVAADDRSRPASPLAAS